MQRASAQVNTQQSNVTRLRPVVATALERDGDTRPTGDAQRRA